MVAPPTLFTRGFCRREGMLSTENARRLVREVDFPGDKDRSYRIAVSGKPQRRALISGDDCRDRRTAAAVEIQRIWRGFRTKKRYTSIAERRKVQEARRAESSRFPLLKKRYADYVKWCSSSLGVGEESSVVMEFREFSARVIQIWWRRVMADCHRDTLTMKVLTEEEAVVRIQSAWRGYQNKKTFSCYQRLISFRQRGDPASLLKTINPSEAKLLDKASGACVRFRLGGSLFPPSIYYKIFTNQSVVDVCSYSPRNYAAMASHRQSARDTHSHGAPVVGRGSERWYERWENNGWRLVSEKFLHSQPQDAVTRKTSARRQAFHHSSLQRKADIERRRKQKKIEWMKKLYQAPPDIQPPSSSEQSDTAAAEDEVDDLLDWTHTLNYDEYVSDWSRIGTSATQQTSHDLAS